MLDDCREAAAAAAVFLLLPARRAEPRLACLYSASNFNFNFFLANHRISGARFLLF